MRYSKASRYTTSSCTDLDNAHFWIGSQKIWDARFFELLLEMHVFEIGSKKIWDARFYSKLLLEMHVFLGSQILMIIFLLLHFHNIVKIFVKENYNFHASISYTRALIKEEVPNFCGMLAFLSIFYQAGFWYTTYHTNTDPG